MRRLTLIAVLAAVLAGCGGAETTSPAPETVEGEAPQAQTPTETQAEGEGEGGGGGGGEGEGTAAAGDAAAGRQVYEQNGCGGCHRFEPAGSTATTGPNLDELPRLAEDADRGTVEEFTRESIEDPNAYVEEGFPAIMPEYDQLDDKQLADLVAFLTQS